MTTVHLIYPHSPRISCPDAMGRNLGKRLERKYRVMYYDFDERRVIKPAPGDMLLGHPTYSPKTCFRLSLSQPGWRRVIAMCPYHHGNVEAVAFLDSFLHHCDLYLAITGNYWYNSNNRSLYAHWRPKMVHVDLAVDRRDFPVVKTSFNPPGYRRFVYIGHAHWTKNPSYLSEIAKASPETPIGWIGEGRLDIPGLISLGYQDFSTERAKNLVASYDFMITVSEADANPATILESMAWGLIPVCTPQSGYIGYPGIVNVPTGDVKQTVEILRQLQFLPETQLKEMQAANWQILDTHFNWDRFARQVFDAIESDASPELDKVSLLRKLRIRYATLKLPFMRFLRFRYLIYYVLYRMNLLKGKSVAKISR